MKSRGSLLVRSPCSVMKPILKSSQLDTCMRVSAAPPLQVAVRATAMASTMSNAAIAARTAAGYAPAQQHSETLAWVHGQVTITAD